MSTETRPQDSFEVKVDNSYEIPFIPKLKEKLNAIEPLNKQIVEA
jgi:hypothetical protein